MPQLVSADGALTGRENLRLSARLCHLPRDLRDTRIDGAERLGGDKAGQADARQDRGHRREDDGGPQGAAPEASGDVVSSDGKWWQDDRPGQK